jgi:uncharacterized membrane protein
MPRGDRAGEERAGELAGVMERNIRAIVARRQAEARRQRVRDRVAERIGRFAGSMTFVYLHLLLFGAWFLASSGLLPLPRFDPTLVKLATFASVEAIFISTFVLVMQNRMAAEADKRADLDLQISLLAEHEVTRLIRLVTEIAGRVGVDVSDRPDLSELQRDVDPEQVLDRLEHPAAPRPEAPSPEPRPSTPGH